MDNKDTTAHAIAMNSIAPLLITMDPEDRWVAALKGVEVETEGDSNLLEGMVGISPNAPEDAIELLWEGLTKPGRVVSVRPDDYSYTRTRYVWAKVLWRIAPPKKPRGVAAPTPEAKQTAEDLVDYRPKPAGFAGEPA